MKTRILTLITALLVSLACSIGTIPDGRTAPPAASTPQLMTGDTPEAPEIEDHAGAVYQIPTVENKLCATVTAAEALHLRAEPRQGAAFLAYLKHGQEVQVITPGRDWWKVRTAAGLTGFAWSKYLQEGKCE